MSSRMDDYRDGRDKAGLRIYKLRIAHGMTQRELGGRKYSSSYISAVERGQALPSLSLLEWCAEQLHVPLITLLTDEPVGTLAGLSLRQHMAEEGYQKLIAARFLTEGNAKEALLVLRRQRQQAGIEAHPSLIWLYAYALCQSGDVETALHEAMIYNETAQASSNPQLLAATHWLLGMIYQRMGQTQRAIDEYQEVLAPGFTTPLAPDFHLRMRSSLAEALLQQGDLTGAYAAASSALHAYEAFADPQKRSKYATAAANVASDASDFIKAYVFACWAWMSQREALARWDAAKLYLRRALLASEARVVGEREHDLQNALTLARISGDEQTAALAVACLAGTLVERSAYDEARRLVEDHFPPDIIVVRENPGMFSAWCMAQAQLEHARGDREAALTHAREAEAVLAALADDDLACDYLLLQEIFAANTPIGRRSVRYNA